MNYAEAEKLLKSCGQEHVLAYWKKLAKDERRDLLAQVAALDPKSLKRCAAALKTGGDTFDSSKGTAPKVADLAGAERAKAVAAGEKELRAGRVAALLVAGGQGSRLGYDGPKGCSSIGPITGAPLFSSTLTFSRSSTISFAFCGQTTKHWPHRMHSLPMMWA